MSDNTSDKLLQIIQQYKKHIADLQESVHGEKRKLEKMQGELEQETLSIISNRNLSTAERTERMIPLMEQQDRLKEFTEELETLVHNSDLGD